MNRPVFPGKWHRVDMRLSIEASPACLCACYARASGDGKTTQVTDLHCGWRVNMPRMLFLQVARIAEATEVTDPALVARLDALFV